MARTDERFRECFNLMLDKCATLSVGDALPPELALAAEMDVSRTVVRAVLRQLHDKGVIDWSGRQKALLRSPQEDDRLAVQNEPISPEALEGAFLNWMLKFDVPPGTPLNVTEMAKMFHVTAYGLQEFLASLSRFGLVRRRSRGGWELAGFTRDYAIELSDFRMILELNAVNHVLTLPEDDPFWKRLDDLERDHRALAAQIEARYHDFSMLDERFHSTLGRTVGNRFVAEFQKVISLIFHYHYQWDKKDERERNAAAIAEHLALIAALKARDQHTALAAARSHLLTSKQTLLNSLRINALP